jgi:hypothetical protein
MAGAEELEEAQVPQDLELLADFVGCGRNIAAGLEGRFHEHNRGMDEGASQRQCSCI